jgi:hypothetical protein
VNNQFRHTDTNKANGLHIQWAMILLDDDTADAPDERDEGFWPSHDPDAAGFVGGDAATFAAAEDAAAERMSAWRNGDWRYVGVVAEARCLVVSNGVGTYYTLKSAGCWGVESDAGDYLNDLFAEEKAALAADLKTLGTEPASDMNVAA